MARSALDYDEEDGIRQHERRLSEYAVVDAPLRRSFHQAFRVASSHGEPLRSQKLDEPLFLSMFQDLGLPNLDGENTAFSAVEGDPGKPLHEAQVRDFLKYSMTSTGSLTFEAFVHVFLRVVSAKWPFPFTPSDARAALRRFANRFLHPYILRHSAQNFDSRHLTLAIVDALLHRYTPVLERVFETYATASNISTAPSAGSGEPSAAASGGAPSSAGAQVGTMVLTLDAALRWAEDFHITSDVPFDDIVDAFDATTQWEYDRENADKFPGGGGHVNTKTLRFPDFVEFSARLAFCVFPGRRFSATEDERDPLPTPQAKVWAFLQSLTEHFTQLFGEEVAPLLVLTHRPPVISAVAPCLEHRLPAVAAVGTTGTVLQLSGAHFAVRHGLFVRMGNTIARAEVSDAQTAQVTVPFQPCQRVLLEVRGGNNPVSVTVALVRTSPLLLSTFRRIWHESPNSTFTYLTTKKQYLISSHMLKQLKAAFRAYSGLGETRAPRGNVSRINYNGWDAFVQNLSLREPLRHQVALHLTDDTPDEPGTVRSLFQEVAAILPDRNEPTLAFCDFVRLAVLCLLTPRLDAPAELVSFGSQASGFGSAEDPFDPVAQLESLLLVHPLPRALPTRDERVRAMETALSRRLRPPSPGDEVAAEQALWIESMLTEGPHWVTPPAEMQRLILDFDEQQLFLRLDQTPSPQYITHSRRDSRTSPRLNSPGRGPPVEDRDNAEVHERRLVYASLLAAKDDRIAQVLRRERLQVDILRAIVEQQNENIRELEQAVERSAATTRQLAVSLEELHRFWAASRSGDAVAAKAFTTLGPTIFAHLFQLLGRRPPKIVNRRQSQFDPTAHRKSVANTRSAREEEAAGKLIGDLLSAGDTHRLADLAYRYHNDLQQARREVESKAAEAEGYAARLQELENLRGDFMSQTQPSVSSPAAAMSESSEDLAGVRGRRVHFTRHADAAQVELLERQLQELEHNRKEAEQRLLDIRSRELYLTKGVGLTGTASVSAPAARKRSLLAPADLQRIVKASQEARILRSNSRVLRSSVLDMLDEFRASCTDVVAKVDKHLAPYLGAIRTFLTAPPSGVLLPLAAGRNYAPSPTIAALLTSLNTQTQLNRPPARTLIPSALGNAPSPINATFPQRSSITVITEDQPSEQSANAESRRASIAAGLVTRPPSQRMMAAIREAGSLRSPPPGLGGRTSLGGSRPGSVQLPPGQMPCTPPERPPALPLAPMTTPSRVVAPGNDERAGSPDRLPPNRAATVTPARMAELAKEPRRRSLVPATHGASVQRNVVPARKLARPPALPPLGNSG
eukprot:TRINITY_DN14084_c0_g1_i1.p1 TRINITY_DN14084_c0_g1~~TRINITY_DN14084_c0_g1_i1.p1  ORF type:complete len:1308 (+),score=137.88 TRINITY_DN14084_c0_g1_i1:1430-5353(+)